MTNQLKKWYDAIEEKKLPFSKTLDGISNKTLLVHHDKLYAGYVKKAKEIFAALGLLGPKIRSGEITGNATYSELRALKDAETFAVNGIYLHEWYFDVLGGDGDSTKAPEFSKALEEKWESIEGAITYISECAMAARGWAIVAWNPRLGRIMQYNADAHNQGGVWGALPIVVLDVYEHAYFIDFGSDRKAYIAAFWKNFNWVVAEAIYLKVKDIKL